MVFVHIVAEMIKRVFIIITLLFCAFGISAQEKETSKVSELPSFWQCEEARAVIDNFFIRLQENSQATGIIIYYEGKYQFDSNENKKPKLLLPRRGEAEYRIQIIRDHIRLRRYDSSRIFIINGGFREENETEFWIVPNGAELPKPSSTLDKIEYRKGKPEWTCDEPF